MRFVVRLTKKDCELLAFRAGRAFYLWFFFGTFVSFLLLLLAHLDVNIVSVFVCLFFGLAVGFFAGMGVVWRRSPPLHDDFWAIPVRLEENQRARKSR